MLRLAETIILAQGWKKHLIALVSGACGALALAPIDAFPAFFISMMAAIWLLDGSAETHPESGKINLSWSSLKNAAGAGWCWGFGYFVAGLWWLGAAFLVEADKFAWALPLGVVGLPAVLAIFPALAFLVARLFWGPGAARIFVFALSLSAMEFARGHVFTGFPWNNFGMVLGGNLILSQVASWVGLYGLTVIAAILFALPALMVDNTREGRKGTKPLFATASLLACLTVFGMVRLHLGETAFVPGVKIRILQPNLPQDEKFRPEHKDAILRHYLALSDKATSPERMGLADVTHVIWPESAFPFILSKDSKALSQIGATLPVGTTLITGAARSVDADSKDLLPGESRTSYFNSVQVISSGGSITSSYDKVHLVPFGEYLPFSRLLEKMGLRHFVHIPGGFEAGERRELLSVAGLPPVAPLVCYEAIFSGEVTPHSSDVQRPGVFINVTNDGWFGLTSGPPQHLSQARLRAIEEGIPLLRSANTGISAVIDPYGRYLKTLPLGSEGVIDSFLPKAIAPTFFSKNPYPGPLMLVLLTIGAAIGLRRRV